MFDTNVYDYIYENKINMTPILEIYNITITSIQISEIQNIKDNKTKRTNILKIIKNCSINKVPRAVSWWDDTLYWDDDDIWDDKITTELIIIENGNIKNRRDAMILGACKRNNIFTLVTSDKAFLKKASSLLKVYDTHSFITNFHKV